ncbi:MAG TPA: chromate efflux transporter [Caulobacteraceae bacterium]|nr:chromate efflux transporter [Caulobacteraceae bacterium]
MAGGPSYGDLARAGLKVGFLGFGGPAGQIALMHRVFVDERRWIDEPRYLHALNYCMLLPGPEAQQLATYVGWLLKGVRGGVLLGLLFILPGALVVGLLSWIYAAWGRTGWSEALFYGIKAAVVALVFEALVKVGRRSLKGPADLAIAVAALAALSLFSVPFPLVVLAAGLIGLSRARRGGVDSEPDGIERRQPSVAGALKAAAVWGGAWLAPLATSFLVLGPGHVVTQVGRLFSTLAVVTFGGAYAVLAYVKQEAVETHGWLSSAQMIDGLGLAETTPGPLILVNQFVGWMAGWGEGGVAVAVACALMASWCTFAPSFLFIFAGAPWAEALRRNARAKGFLAGVSAAVLGVIAHLGLWFALHVLFARTGQAAAPWGASVDYPVLVSFDPVAAALAVAAAFALMRLKWSAPVVILLCGLVGLTLGLPEMLA